MFAPSGAHGRQGCLRSQRAATSFYAQSSENRDDEGAQLCGYLLPAITDNYESCPVKGMPILVAAQ